jgi:hypothetical protein
MPAMASQELREILLMNGSFAAMKGSELVGIVIDADYVMTQFRETGGSHKPNISRTNNRNLHA